MTGRNINSIEMFIEIKGALPDGMNNENMILIQPRTMMKVVTDVA